MTIKSEIEPTITIASAEVILISLLHVSVCPKFYKNFQFSFLLCVWGVEGWPHQSSVHALLGFKCCVSLIIILDPNLMKAAA